MSSSSIISSIIILDTVTTRYAYMLNGKYHVIIKVCLLSHDIDILHGIVGPECVSVYDI